MSILRWFFRGVNDHLYLLVDETQLIAGWQTLVVAVAFWHRAIPVFWFIYSDEQIRAGVYKSHNEIIQYFCEYVHQVALGVVSKPDQRPVLVFDRGFARGCHVIKFLKDRDIAFVMRVPKHVGIRLDGSLKKLDALEAGWYPHILYQTHEQIPLQLYIIRDEAFKDPMYLISNRLKGHQIHHCYKRRMQIEHGNLRDIKSYFGFGELVLKKPTQVRLETLWFCACWLMDYSLSVMRRSPLHIGRRHIILITEKLFLLLRLSNVCSPISGTNIFLSHFSRRYIPEAIRFLRLLETD